MLHYLKEIYFTAFTFFARSAKNGGWNWPVSVSIGVACVCLTESLFMLGMMSWFDVLVGSPILFSFPSWILGIVYIPLFVANKFILVKRGGTKFEHEFDKLPKSKRFHLQTACLGTLLSIVVFLFSAVPFHLKLYH
jgi:hypothetical protein